jgi:glycosyltransferase involved in cell wall biosynthesis
VKSAYLISHPIDYTGAPRVLLDIAEELVSLRGFAPADVHIIYPTIDAKIEADLVAKGYSLHCQDGLNSSALEIKADDFVLLNSTFVWAVWADHVLNMLQNLTLNKAYWFIHEDHFDYIKRIPNVAQRSAHLINAGKLTVVTPSADIAKTFQEYFDGAPVKAVQLYVHSLALTDKSPKPPKVFDHIHFFLSGSPRDGRKGQLIFLAGLQQFINTFARRSFGRYRPFDVHLISIGDDYISQTAKIFADSMAGAGVNVHFYPHLDFTQTAKVQEKCNVSVCTSLGETFGLSIAEGMVLGHVVLRNNTGGHTEQVRDGFNGFLFERGDILGLAKKLERLLNKRTTSNNTLAEMSQNSQAMIAPYLTSRYIKQLEC